MAKKYLSLERLQEYDALIKQEVVDGDSTTLSSSKSYTDAEVGKIKSGTIVVSKAENANHATTADSATNATNATNAVNANHATTADSATTAGSATTADDASKFGGQSPDYYAKASDIPTGALADKDIVSESDLDSALAEKVNAAAEGNHSHSNKSVLDGITSGKVSAWDDAEANAKAYADEKVANLLNNSTEAVDSIMELAKAMEDNADAIEALEKIASGKADAEHDHAIDDVTGLQSALNGKADVEHGIHVEFDSTAPKMDGTASAGTSTKVARADHVHPTDTSRASQAAFDELVQTVAGKSDSGHGHDIATSSTSGFMSAAMVEKLAGIDDGANKTIVDEALSSTSTNPVQNKAVYNAVNTATQAILANTNSIDAHNTAITNLQNAVDAIQEITSADIQALFA